MYEANSPLPRWVSAPVRERNWSGPEPDDRRGCGETSGLFSCKLLLLRETCYSTVDLELVAALKHDCY